jgi:hypothetical protein
MSSTRHGKNGREMVMTLIAVITIAIITTAAAGLSNQPPTRKNLTPVQKGQRYCFAVAGLMIRMAALFLMSGISASAMVIQVQEKVQRIHTHKMALTMLR